MTLAARDISFSYSPSRPVFDGLSVEVSPGVTVVLGPNGAGKSTLLRLLLAALKPTRGSIELDGAPLRSLKAGERASRLAYVAQRPAMASAFTVREVVALGRFALAQDQNAVDDAITSLGLDGMADRVFASLSVGEQQRASLARALAQLASADESHRRILLADEPTSAMDPRWVVRCSGVIRSLKDRGIDAVLVLHDFTLAARFADRVLLLDEQGAVAHDGPPDSALDPAVLREVFGTEFTRTESEGGPVVSPVLPGHATGGEPTYTHQT